MKQISLEQKVKEMLKKTEVKEKVLIIPDMHCPYEDTQAAHAVISFSQEYKPDRIELMGDLVDFYDLSSFDKDSNRINVLQQELDVARYYLGLIREANPDAEINMYEGNHEDRLNRYLKKNPEMSSLRKINSPDKLLDLKEFNISYKQFNEKHKILYKHGNKVRKHSSYTAKGELEDEGISGVSGHTHRFGMHFKTDRSGTRVWMEAGHLCNESKAEYMSGKVANWQKGFAVAEVSDKTNMTYLHPIIIENNSFVFNGHTYSWRSNASFQGRQDAWEGKDL